MRVWRFFWCEECRVHVISDSGFPVFECPSCCEFMELRFMKDDTGLFELLKKGEEYAKVPRV
jgi:hypothetical protein